MAYSRKIDIRNCYCRICPKKAKQEIYTGMGQFIGVFCKFHGRRKESEITKRERAEMISVGEIIKAYLEKHKYDGLYNPDGECSCDIDGLEPCGMMSSECRAGYKGPCDCGEGCDHHIGREKKI